MGKILKFFISLLTFVIIVGMAVAVFLFTQSGELPKIEGRKDILAKKIKKRKMLDHMQLAVNSKDTLVITEEQLNHYLASKVKISQAGKASEYLDIKGIWVDLTEDWVTFYIERAVKLKKDDSEESNEAATPYQHLTKFGFKVVTFDHKDMSIEKIITPTSGRIGETPVPGLFGKLAKAPLDKLAESFPAEMELFYKMTDVRVFDGRIEMSARDRGAGETLKAN